jgi:hypothetical protein
MSNAAGIAETGRRPSARCARAALDEAGLRSMPAHEISDGELQAAVEGLAAGRLLLVIDACNSGQALEAEERRRGPMNSKGLAQLAYEKGMCVLTAAQSYQAALEASQLGRGLLTYVLVEEGLKRMAAAKSPATARWWRKSGSTSPRCACPRCSRRRWSRRALGVSLSFAAAEAGGAHGREVQRPRAFYRRELESGPLVFARTSQ